MELTRQNGTKVMEFSDPTARVQSSKLWEEDIFHKNREISVLTMKKKQQG
jgi:hypothetical protein